MAGASAVLDDVFQEIGELGPNQIVTFALLFVLNVLSGTSTVNYMISGGNLEYRCVFEIIMMLIIIIQNSYEEMFA